MKTVSVPPLNLAPKRRKPLSLWNPLDYIRLLYWVFFFPQALRWYIENFGEKKKTSKYEKSSELWQSLIGYPLSLRSFWIQSFVVIILLPFAIRLILQNLNFWNSSIGVAAGAIFGIAVGVAFSIAFNLFIGSIFGVWAGISIGITGNITVNAALVFTWGVMGGVLYGVIGHAVTNIAVGIAAGIALGLNYGAVNGIVLGILLSIANSRLEVWLAVVFFRCSFTCRLKSFGPVTAIPLPNLTQQISSWLRHDWIQAVSNINELLTYTRQFIPVAKAVNESLSKLPNDVLVLRLSQLAEKPYNWNVVRYASAPLNTATYAAVLDEVFIRTQINNFKFSTSNHLLALRESLGRRMLARYGSRLRLDTPARAVAAGFWLLHEGQPRKAAEAFAQVQNLPHGTEMYQLATCLFLASTAEQLNDDRLVNGLTIPTSPLLRSDTWPAISGFRSVVDDAQIISQSFSRSARSLALNRALGNLTEITQQIDRVPQAERKLVASIAESWQKKLLAIATDIGEITHTQPVHNPYVAGDPVEGSLFVGRGEIIKQLEELWLMSSQLQSVVLYGHRRMGKTSILKNLSHYLGNNIKVVYINLLNLGEVSEGTGEVLITLSDAISQSFSLSPPDDETLLRLPEVTFRRFIQAINQKLKDNQGLIIALDEFEKIEELILAGKLRSNFLGFLRGLLQEHPKIAFAFAGLHTLEEMTEDYFNPLFASILPIRIGFFSIGETRQLLANPAEDFTLDYTPETLNEIYRLTAGQPYLTQLIGFQLVRHYNHQVFEQGRERSPIFTPEDLTAIIHHSDFFAKGRYYFTGVWNQASQDAPGQQAILKVLASKVKGSAQSEIRRQTNLSPTEIDQALKTLQRHDVVKAEEGKWRIIVPLFRQWVLDY